MLEEQLLGGVTEQASDLVRAEAPGALRPPTARLLSEHTLLAHGEPGLPSWRPEEAQRNLREAVALTMRSKYWANAKAKTAAEREGLGPMANLYSSLSGNGWMRSS